MENLPTLLYATILLTSVIGILLGILTVAFLMLIRRYVGLKKEYEKIAQIERKKVEAAVDTLIKDVKEFNYGLRDQLKSQLTKISTEETNQYEKTLKEGREQMVDVFQNISQDVKKIVNQESQTLNALVLEGADKITQQYQVSLNEAKEAYMKNLEEKVVDIVSDISKNVIGKSLSRQDHEDLIIKSLSEAKKQNVL